MRDAVVYLIGLIGFLIAGAWISYRLTLRAAYIRQRDALDRLRAFYEGKLADANGQTDRMSDALYNLLGAITAPSGDADALDAAVVGGEAALDGHGYTGQLTAARAALEQALADADGYRDSLRWLLEAGLDPAKFNLYEAITHADALLLLAEQARRRT